MLGQHFERRGARMEEQVEVLRALWRGGMVGHHGEFYDFEPVEMSPAPTHPVPILVGGHSEVALRRAARIGDGWMGTYYTLDDLRGYVERLQGYRREYGTEDRPFEVQASILDVPTNRHKELLSGMRTTLERLKVAAEAEHRGAPALTQTHEEARS